MESPPLLCIATPRSTEPRKGTPQKIDVEKEEATMLALEFQKPALLSSEAHCLQALHGETAATPSLEPKKPASPPVRVRSVWAHNLEAEFQLIRSCLSHFTIAAMDTEFPGVIYHSTKHHGLLSPAERYHVLKTNVDKLHLIQLGLTLSNAEGDLPTFGTDHAYVWEFNFKDFDIYRDYGSPDSVALLMTNGIDYQRNRREGIDSRLFGRFMVWSGLVCNGSAVTWVTFHGTYDLGYVIKALMRCVLPPSVYGFLNLIWLYFGEKVYDMKHMMKYCDGLYGGLERVATLLKVERKTGKSHQAGSDSLLTLQTFLTMRELYFKNDDGEKHAGVVFGLEA